MNVLEPPISRPPKSLWMLLRQLYDLFMSWLPLLLITAASLFSIWLVRTTPLLLHTAPESVKHQESDYDIRQFALKSYDLQGKLKSSITGLSAMHSPQTMRTLVEEPRVIIYKNTTTTFASAQRAWANEDGSEVQLLGQAVIQRQPTPDEPQPLRVQSDFLHVFANTDSVHTPLPTTISKGKNNFSGASMQADNLNQRLVMKGRVKAVMYPEDTAP